MCAWACARVVAECSWSTSMSSVLETLISGTGCLDGQQVLAGSLDVKLWCAVSRGCLRTFHGLVWCAVSGECMCMFQGHVLLSLESACARSSATAELLCAVSGECCAWVCARFVAECSRSTCMSFVLETLMSGTGFLDGQPLLTCTLDVKLWCAVSGGCLRTFHGLVWFAVSGRCMCMFQGDVLVSLENACARSSAIAELLCAVSGEFLRTLDGDIVPASSTGLRPIHRSFSR